MVFTVRSLEKGAKILAKYPKLPRSRLSYDIVEEISQPGACDQVMVSTPPFQAVIHTASPFHFNFTDASTEILLPAIRGTREVLHSIKRKAPTVKTVVITSSFASIVNPSGHPDVYDEKVWNPITMAEAYESPAHTYRASKKLAEREAWQFIEKEMPNFSISTICPPLVFGPVSPDLTSLDSINTSNERFRDLLQGKWQKEVQPTATILWVDVRDVALAHVQAMEIEDAWMKRFLVAASFFSNKAIADMMRINFPDMADRLPPEASFDDMPQKTYKFNNKRSVDVLEMNYRSLEESVVDTVNSMLKVDPSLAPQGSRSD